MQILHHLFFVRTCCVFRSCELWSECMGKDMHRRMQDMATVMEEDMEMILLGTTISIQNLFKHL